MKGSWLSMMIKKQLVKSRASTFSNTNKRKYITIHETGNTKKGAGAQAHANLQTKGFSASWHWQVDDRIAIQSFPHSVSCWHAGDGYGAGNLQSIAIEICVNEDSLFEKAVANAIDLTKMIMKEENIPVDCVVQHHYWTRKDCPSRLRSGKSGINWAIFKERLRAKATLYEGDLRLGSIGAAVKDLQSRLNHFDFNLVIDGSFGPLTRNAVIQFQRNNGLEVDGIVGPGTWAALKKMVFN